MIHNSSSNPSGNMSFSEIRKKLEDDGFATVEGFLTPVEIDEMKKSMPGLIDPINISFMFHNDEGYDDDLRIGNALHWSHSTFRKITFSDKVRSLCTELGLLDPLVVESMVSLKKAHIYGGEVNIHQDATYISTNPESVVAFWFPMVDVTLHNGCIWVAKKSHKNGLLRRFARTFDPHPYAKKMAYDRPPLTESEFQFEPILAKSGDCILIDSLTVHKCEKNTSETDRPVYCFRTAEKRTRYSSMNWIQPNMTNPFVPIFDHYENSFENLTLNTE